MRKPRQPAELRTLGSRSAEEPGKIRLFLYRMSTPSGQHRGMPAAKTFLGLVLRAAAMAALADIKDAGLRSLVQKLLASRKGA